MAPADPILGVTEAFVADSNPKKVNLGVGVYTDDNGRVPLLECVKRAEELRMKTSPHRGYLPIDGLGTYDKAVQELVFGALKSNIVTVQAIGGTGGLKIGADFLKLACPAATVWISDPSWENHRQLFEHAGFTVKAYTYYDPATHGLNFAGMKAALESMQPGSIVVLHACCHNPTGVDLTQEQWKSVLEIVQSRSLVPFLDLAYQGFAEGLAPDGFAARLFSDAMSPVFLSSSFSKSFSLYGERAGALSVVTSSPEEATRVLSQVKRVVRANYSNPPTHGSQVIATVLADPTLRAQWDGELAGMRDRIKLMRTALVDKLKAAGVKQDMGFITDQVGMFSYSGLSKDQVRRLREENSIYTIDTGRVCVAALTTKNVDYVADAIAKVIR
ncbi:MAG TPA: amino acid aminotransferase [Reyranella sp.]|nr:amino acid aminotransferase [Reyranella sp.]